jgi:hypothetical protein
VVGGLPLYGLYGLASKEESNLKLIPSSTSLTPTYA